MYTEKKLTGKTATPGFQASWLKNPDGSPGKKLPLVTCGKGCAVSEECFGCPHYRVEQMGLAGHTEFILKFVLQPFRWSTRQTIFVCNEGDLFHDDVQEWCIHLTFAMMKSCPQHRFVLLTKRSRRMEQILVDPKFQSRVDDVGHERLGPHYQESWGHWGSNIVLGVSVGRQKYMWRSEILPNLPEAVTKCIFAAPMLGPMTVPKNVLPYLGWVVCSAERGSKWCEPRPCALEWQIDLKDQCVASNVPFHLLRRYDRSWVKEMGGTWLQFPKTLIE
jgi:protein gp37